MNYINPQDSSNSKLLRTPKTHWAFLTCANGNFQETLVHKNLPITPIPPPDDSPEFGTAETTVAVITTVIVFCCYRCCWNCCCWSWSMNKLCCCWYWISAWAFASASYICLCRCTSYFRWVSRKDCCGWEGATELLISWGWEPLVRGKENSGVADPEFGRPPSIAHIP